MDRKTISLVGRAETPRSQQKEELVIFFNCFWVFVSKYGFSLPFCPAIFGGVNKQIVKFFLCGAEKE